MSEVVVRPLEPERFAVEVAEGTVRTHHKVAVHGALLDELGIPDADPSAVARATVDFLLERETAAGLWQDFPVEQVAEHYPDFYDELLVRLAP